MEIMQSNNKCKQVINNNNKVTNYVTSPEKR